MMTEEMKINRLMIAAEMVQSAYEQVQSIITTPEHVELLGEVQISLEESITKSKQLAERLLRAQAYQRENTS